MLLAVFDAGPLKDWGSAVVGVFDERHGHDPRPASGLPRTRSWPRCVGLKRCAQVVAHGDGRGRAWGAKPPDRSPCPRPCRGDCDLRALARRSPCRRAEDRPACAAAPSAIWLLDDRGAGEAALLSGVLLPMAPQLGRPRPAWSRCRCRGRRDRRPASRRRELRAPRPIGLTSGWSSRLAGEGWAASAGVEISKPSQPV